MFQNPFSVQAIEDGKVAEEEGKAGRKAGRGRPEGRQEGRQEGGKEERRRRETSKEGRKDGRQAERKEGSYYSTLVMLLYSNMYSFYVLII